MMIVVNSYLQTLNLRENVRMINSLKNKNKKRFSNLLTAKTFCTNKNYTAKELKYLCNYFQTVF